MTDADAPRRTPTLIKLAVTVVATLVLLIAAEGGAGLLLAWKDSGDVEGIREELHCQYDPDLGWSHRASVHVGDLYGKHRALTTNARGFRATEEYTDEVPEGRYRVICAGDSFTLGYGVDDAATYEAELEAQEPRLQAVNMGQGGYGVDQAYLWYKRDGVRLDADLVLFVFIAPDFERMLDARFNGQYSKPLLRAVDGELQVDNVPVPNDFDAGGGQRAKLLFERIALGELLRRATRPNRVEQAMQVAGSPLPFREPAQLMLADLAQTCTSQGSELVLVQLPLLDPLAGRPEEVSAWISDVAAELEVPFVDLSPDFRALPPAEAELYYQPDGHFNALGNRLVAERLLVHLRRVLPSFPR
ncbi:MAG: SGNH/GDSL hydrolase family protein [Planctomycetota bacterium]